MAAVQLGAKPTDQATILYNLAFSAIDAIHDGHGPARNAMIDNPMFKGVSKPITDNPRLQMTNEVVKEYPFNDTNISNITRAFGPATLGFAGTVEDAYKSWIESSPEAAPNLKTLITRLNNKSAGRPPAEYMPNADERVRTRIIADYSRPSKKVSFKPLQVDPLEKDVVLEFVDVAAGRVGNHRPVVTPAWVVDPGPKPTDKEFRALYSEQQNYDIDGALLQCGPRVRKLYIRELKPIQDGSKRKISAKVILEIENDGPSLFIPVSSEKTLANSSRFLQVALAAAKERTTNLPGGLIGGNPAVKTILENAKESPILKAAAMIMKIAGDALTAEFLDNAIGDILTTDLLNLYGDQVVHNTVTLPRYGITYDGLCASHMQRQHTEGEVDTVFHKPASGGELTLQITRGPGNIGKTPLADIKAKILSEFQSFRNAWGHSEGVRVTCKYDGEDRDITEYVDKVSSQLTRLERRLSTHLGEFLDNDIDYNRLVELRATLFPSQKDFRGKRSPATYVSICKIRNREYTIFPQKDIGMLLTRTATLETVSGVGYKKKGVGRISLAEVVLAPPAAEAAPAPAAEAAPPSENPKGGSRKKKQKRRTLRRLRRQRGGAKYANYAEYVNDILDLYTLSFIDGSDEGTDNDLEDKAELAGYYGELYPHLTPAAIRARLPPISDDVSPVDPEWEWDIEHDIGSLMIQDKITQQKAIERRRNEGETIEEDLNHYPQIRHNEFWNLLDMWRGIIESEGADEETVKVFSCMEADGHPMMNVLGPAYVAYRTACEVTYRQERHADEIESELERVNAKINELKDAGPIEGTDYRVDAITNAAVSSLVFESSYKNWNDFVDAFDPPPASEAQPPPSTREYPAVRAEDDEDGDGDGMGAAAGLSNAAADPFNPAGPQYPRSGPLYERFDLAPAPPAPAPAPAPAAAAAAAAAAPSRALASAASPRSMTGPSLGSQAVGSPFMHLRLPTAALAPGAPPPFSPSARLPFTVKPGRPYDYDPGAEAAARLERDRALNKRPRRSSEPLRGIHGFRPVPAAVPEAAVPVYVFQPPPRGRGGRKTYRRRRLPKLL